MNEFRCNRCGRNFDVDYFDDVFEIGALIPDLCPDCFNRDLSKDES
ncbi:MAG: hypothetical protein Q8942_18620 [Bacillota bacterium]|nr:hypothetical protein [Bacillota bacterium]